MNIFEKKRDIESIRALPEEVSTQIINSIYRQIYNIGYHIRDGERMAESEWPIFMGMREYILEELRNKQIEYRTFLRETNIILFGGDENINHKGYLRAFNNFMSQMQEEAVRESLVAINSEYATAKEEAFAKNREYATARENAYVRNRKKSLIENAKVRLRAAIARDMQSALDAGLVKKSNI
jgi:hypothetical protein